MNSSFTIPVGEGAFSLAKRSVSIGERALSLAGSCVAGWSVPPIAGGTVPLTRGAVLIQGGALTSSGGSDPIEVGTVP